MNVSLVNVSFGLTFHRGTMYFKDSQAWNQLSHILTKKTTAEESPCCRDLFDKQGKS